MQTTLRKTTLAAAITGALFSASFVSANARANELSDMKAMLAQLQDRVAQMEAKAAQPAQAAAMAPAATAASMPAATG
ncbi:MAG: hypothetical protein RSE46_22525, partial [Janthinobacterium sp.]